MKRSLGWKFVVLSLALGVISPAYAVLERVGPVDPDPRVGSFPSWYQDTTGLALEFCDPLNQAEVDGGWCLLLPGDVTIPEVFPTNFFDEHFYFAAGANMAAASNGSTIILVLAVESAFSAGPAIPGDQITFSRIRVRLTEAPVSGTYRFIHPYGEEVFDNVAAGDRIFFTDDVGIGAPGDFSGALNSRLGPFLLASNTPGGAELAGIPGPVPGKLYIADPGRLGPVTGSPLGTFLARPDTSSSTGGTPANHNVFRLEGPVGSNLGGTGVNSIETTDFSLMGRVFTQAIPGRVVVDRANYTRNATAQKVDVYATGLPTTQGRVPAGATPPAATPQLSFYAAPCAGATTDPLTGLPNPPLSAPVGGTAIQMLNAGTSYWAQTQPLAIPTFVCVADANARDAAGQQVTLFQMKSVVDEVSISEALYDVNAGSLSVRATSSDTLLPPTLTLGGFTPGDLAAGAILVTPLAAPPAKVRVISSSGGANDFQVATTFGTGVPPTGPVAVNDSLTIAEDSPAQTIAVLTNDTNAAGGTVALTSTPGLGTAVLNPLTNTVTYTPRLNAFGNDSFTYTVTVGTTVSNTATVAITITNVNDPPVAANNGTFTVRVGVATVLPNLLTNDTDPDGATDLVAAASLTAPTPAGALITGGAGGLVTVNATAAGTYTFTYRAQDAAGLLSAPATVTVRAVTADTVVAQAATFRTTAKRWVISGTDSIGGQVITLTYANGSAAGTTIGTATGDAAGNWILDIRGVSGVLDPTTIPLATRPTQVRATSPLGGTGVVNITIRN
jgi:hypothetical protein